jgi:hypothetical protein
MYNTITALAVGAAVRRSDLVPLMLISALSFTT